MAATQDNCPIRIDTPLGKDTLLLKGFTVREELGWPFEIIVDLQSDRADLVIPEKILNQPVSIRINLPEGGYRYFHGMVEEFQQIGFSHLNFTSYYARIVPGVSLLRHASNCRMYTGVTIPEVLELVLKEHGIKFESERLEDLTYEKLNHCVQYKESTWNFIHRLMIKAGIFFFHRHEAGSHTMVLCNTSPSDYLSLSNQETKIRYNPDIKAGDSINVWKTRHKVQPESYTLDSYDYTHAKTLMKSDGGFAPKKLALYDYESGHRAASGEVTQFLKHEAKIRLERHACRKQMIFASGNVLRIEAGSTFIPQGPMPEITMLTTAMNLRIKKAEFNSVEASVGDIEVRCDFSAIPRTLPFQIQTSQVSGSFSSEMSSLSNSMNIHSESREVEHAATYTPIYGVQTATVANSFEVDGIGSVQVVFPWDSSKTPSDFIRVSQISAGSGWGSMFVPRPGNEVIVAFEDGDPSLPVIVGCVYNSANLPPLGLPTNKTKSYISDDGGNAISLDPSASYESVTIYSKKSIILNAEYADAIHVVGAYFKSSKSEILLNSVDI